MCCSLTQGVTGLVFPGADVQPGEKDSMVMPFTPLPHQSRLPLTETIEGLVSVMIYCQTQLEMKGEIQQKQARVIHLITNKCPLRKSAYFQNLCVNQLTGSCSSSNKLTTTMLMSVPMVPSLKRLETCEEEEENTFTQWYTITTLVLQWNEKNKEATGCRTMLCSF